MLRNISLPPIEERSKVAHALFATPQSVQKLEARRMRHQAQQFRKFNMCLGQSAPGQYIQPAEYSLGVVGLDSVKNRWEYWATW